MKKKENSWKFAITFLMFIIFNSINSFASDHPEAHFGKYGIKHLSTLAEYQQTYIGKTVKYIHANSEESYKDKSNFRYKGGKYNTKYIISKISGDDKRMVFVLKEKETGKTVKMTINNQFELNSDDKDCYCITGWFSVPLLLTDEFEADSILYLKKRFGKEGSSVYASCKKLYMKEQEKTYPIKYPIPTLLLFGNNMKEFECEASNIKDLEDIGTVYSNPKFKCKYTVINVFRKGSVQYRNIDKYYTVRNSIDGKTKEIKVYNAEKDAFRGDDSRHFNAALVKVEKPSVSSDRYGKTTEITDNKITKYSYVDDIIDILIYGGSHDFSFIIKNVSDNSIKIVWNEAVFVDVDGTSSKIMHSGIKYSQREGDQPASTIIKGAKIEDIATPIDKVYYSDNLKKWTSKSLYSNADKDKEDQTLKLMLPIQIKETINEYIFEFKLSYILNHPEYLADSDVQSSKL